MDFLENVYIGSDRNLEDFRFPVQYVVRPDLNFRGYCGAISSGIVRKGDEVVALPSRKTSRIKSIVTYDGELDEAFAPLSVTLTLEDEIDISRGDMIVRPGNMPRIEQKFDAMIVWMSEQPMVPGKQYVFKQTSKSTTGAIDTLRYQVDVNSLHRKEAPTLQLNEIGRCSVTLNQPIAYDGYRRNRSSGAMIVIDRLTNATVGAGMILDRVTDEQRQDHWDDAQSTTLHGEVGQVTAEERQARFGQKPVTVLLTGLTGAGKTTTAYALERQLFDAGRAATVLDGQNMRMGISKDLGFTSQERSENLRRSAEVASLINEAGLICIAAFVAPDESIRRRAAEVIGEDRFLVVHLDAPIEVCRQRDVDGHYAKADEGEFVEFPGVSATYEPPAQADLTLATDQLSVDACVQQILGLLEERGALS